LVAIPNVRNDSLCGNKLGDVALQQLKRLLRKDHILARNGTQAMNFHAADTPCVIVGLFERNDLAAIRAALVDQLLQLLQEPPRKLQARFAGRHRNFDMHAFGMTEALGRRQQDGE
jgi:hypothetical protein